MYSLNADDTAVERLVEPGVILLRALHVHNVDRVVVRFQVLVRLLEATWYEPSFLDGGFVLREPHT